MKKKKKSTGAISLYISYATANVDGGTTAGCQCVKKRAKSMRTLHTSIRGGDAHADIADGRRFTARRRPQVGLLSTVTRCFNSDPLRYNVAFVAEKKALVCGCYTGSIRSSNHPLPTTEWRLTLQPPYCFCNFYFSENYVGLKRTNRVGGVMTWWKC